MLFGSRDPGDQLGAAKRVKRYLPLTELKPASGGCQRCGGSLTERVKVLFSRQARVRGLSIQPLNEQQLAQFCFPCGELIEMRNRKHIKIFGNREQSLVPLASLWRGFVHHDRCTKCKTKFGENPCWELASRMERRSPEGEIRIPIDEESLVQFCGTCKDQYDFTKVELGIAE